MDERTVIENLIGFESDVVKFRAFLSLQLQLNRPIIIDEHVQEILNLEKRANDLGNFLSHNNYYAHWWVCKIVARTAIKSIIGIILGRICCYYVPFFLCIPLVFIVSDKMGFGSLSDVGYTDPTVLSNRLTRLQNFLVELRNNIRDTEWAIKFCNDDNWRENYIS